MSSCVCQLFGTAAKCIRWPYYTEKRLILARSFSGESLRWADIKALVVVAYTHMAGKFPHCMVRKGERKEEGPKVFFKGTWSPVTWRSLTKPYLYKFMLSPSRVEDQAFHMWWFVDTLHLKCTTRVLSCSYKILVLYPFWVLLNPYLAWILRNPVSEYITDCADEPGKQESQAHMLCYLQQKHRLFFLRVSKLTRPRNTGILGATEMLTANRLL